VAQTKPKSKKIIIHSSPFLRCIQTSIGIAAGIGQSVTKFAAASNGEHVGNFKSHIPSENEHRRSRPRERLKDTSKWSMQTLDEEEEHPPISIEKPILKVDAFLGEWLSPDYFEHITPPPSSPLMVLSAKAALLLEEDIDTFEPPSGAVGNFPGGWQRTPQSDLHIDMTSGRSSLAQALSRQRASSQSRISEASGSSNNSSTLSAFLAYGGYYHPPIPTYKVSPSDPIPRGYVSNARNVCADVDLQWDSMKEPQEWGDGGEFEEEWSSMHRRFRRGLMGMVNWYQDHSVGHGNGETCSDTTIGEDDDHELIVILVTHSSGCNALIGAMTNQPVLIDAGQASLTLATRSPKVDPYPALSSSPTGHRREPVDIGLSNEYEVKIRASTDHLRADAGSSSLTGILSGQSPNLRPTQDSTRITETLSFRPATARKFSRATRTFSSSSSSPTSSAGPTRSSTVYSSGGLWKKSQPVSSDNNPITSSAHFELPSPALDPSDEPPLHDTTSDNGSITDGQGLWSKPKRRWTTTESDL
jgi:hypothetical protein